MRYSVQWWDIRHKNVRICVSGIKRSEPEKEIWTRKMEMIVSDTVVKEYAFNVISTVHMAKEFFAPNTELL